MTLEKPVTQRSREFEALVLAHLDILYAVALKLTRNPTEAQDLTQNAVVKALRFHDHFQEGTYIKAWLLTILRNTFINDYRRKVRQPDTVELSGAEPAPDTHPEDKIPEGASGPSAASLMELLDDPVKKAIDELPADFRQTVVMADLEGKSYKEIADEVGCPLGTVMSRLFRGRKILRVKLEDYARSHGMKPRNSRN
jgi:RNA polymerase sigma-70 factor (ECF subfamily)